MSRYSYSYQTIVRYDAIVTKHNFLVRCQPREDCGVRILEQHIDLLSWVNVNYGVDVFGNNIIYGSMMTPHDIFVVAVNGIVECGDYRIVDDSPSPYYRSFTPKTQPSAEISEFGGATPRNGSALDQMLELSHRLHTNMSYIPGVTSTDSSAAESFSMSAGVCQDFAHLLISLARDRGIKARYVAGLVEGTGETHAWVEIYNDDGVWYGIDPTHDRLVERGYIKLSHGRDALDCSVSRGMHRGSPYHTTEVKVVVKELFV